MNNYLIYINLIGKNYKGNYIYEFIYSDSIEDVDGDNWGEYPASGRPSPPYDVHIKKVGRLESELRLDVVQNSDTFSFWDAVDGVISLGWENINDYDTYPDKRLCFKFGEDIETVEAKLYEKDLILQYNTKTHGK